ncbi:MAG TPA: hypothetical protein PLY16_02435 [Candidatus Saccharibacteria bacterium]|nr:hypothetical protein [Candidatus Saccharibacteria bacterium]
MASRSGQKTKLIVTIVALLVTISMVAVIVWWAQQSKQTAPNVEQDDTSQAAPDPTPQPSPTPAPDPSDDDSTNNIDTSNAEELVIEPLDIVMYYDKDLLGFEYHILRTAEGTQYIEFSTERLIGNKCTNDKGVFASFIKNPSTEEDRSTLSQETNVNGDTYGLTLTGESCASDLTLLETYQKGLADYFSLLKPWEEN